MAQGYDISVEDDKKSYSFKIIPSTVVEMTNDKPITRTMIEKDISLLFTKLGGIGVSKLSNSDIQKGILALGGAK